MRASLYRAQLLERAHRAVVCAISNNANTLHATAVASPGDVGPAADVGVRGRWAAEAAPLLHMTEQIDDEGIDRAYVAHIREHVVHRMRYVDGGWRDGPIALYSTVQPVDTQGQIAEHYLGPRAAAAVIERANPRLPRDADGRLEAG